MVIQENHWTCDVCGAVASVREETSPYSDPVVVYPSGWMSLEIPPEHRLRPNLDCCDACLSCSHKPNWESYRARAGHLNEPGHA